MMYQNYMWKYHEIHRFPDSMYFLGKDNLVFVYG